MNKTLTLIAIGGIAFTGGAQAAGISAQIAGLNNADGTTLAGTSKTIAIIDVEGDGLAGFDFANWDGSTFLPDPDDAIVTDDVRGIWNEATGDGDGFEDLSGPLAPSVLDTTPGGLYSFPSADAAG